MCDVLLLSVGGSPQPILTSIKSLKPERAIFVCSSGVKSSAVQVNGPGKPCRIKRTDGTEEAHPNLLVQLGREDRFDPETDLVMVEPDDPADAYRKVAVIIRDLKKNGLNVGVDYTGGTKSMSLALAMAAMDLEAETFLTTSERTDLVRVARGESTEGLSFSSIDVERRLHRVIPGFLKQYNYAAAENEVRLMMIIHLDRETRDMLRRLLQIFSALDRWDQFRHDEAMDLLRGQMCLPVIRDYGILLKKIIHGRIEIDASFKPLEKGVKGNGYEVVMDLVANARRRAAQQRYDDAVGRLYRALELLVQTYLLREHGVKTGGVDLEKVPPAHRSKYEKYRNQRKDGLICVPLWQSYELAGDLRPEDPLRNIFMAHKEKIGNILEARNQSILAHGFKPLSENDYKELEGKFDAFYQEALKAAVPNQEGAAEVQLPDTVDGLL